MTLLVYTLSTGGGFEEINSIGGIIIYRKYGRKILSLSTDGGLRGMDLLAKTNLT
jgi:hypothetical protein